MSVPPRDAAQRRAALDESSRVRRVRSELKADLANRRVELLDVLTRRNDPAIANMRVAEVVEALPGYGPARTAALMQQVGIAANRRVRGLGARQLRELDAEFGGSR
ncbi:MAG: integration host factor, actinobacterial type, partial [Nitriliruptoraceae bacterium]